MTREGFEKGQGEDPLEDIASHMPPEPQQSSLGELIGLIHDTNLRQTKVTTRGFRLVETWSHAFSCGSNTCRGSYTTC
jgi:hypothetical protein